jgi:hypothetical protein
VTTSIQLLAFEQSICSIHAYETVAKMDLHHVTITTPSG